MAKLNEIYSIFLLIVSLMGISAQSVRVLYAKYVRHKKSYGYVDYFSPFIAFSVAYGIIYGLGGIIYTNGDSALLSRMAFISVGGLVALWFGIYFANIISKSGVQKQILQRVRRPSARKWTAFILVGFYLVTAAVGIYVFVKAGNPLFASDPEEARTMTIKIVGGWIYYLYRTNAIVFIIIFVTYGDKLRKHPLFSMSLIAFSMFIILSSGFRTTALIVVLTFLFYRHYAVRRITRNQLIFLISIVYGAFILYGAFRYQGMAANYESALFFKISDEMVVPVFNTVRILEYFPSKYPHFFGLYLLQPFLTVLPGHQSAMGDILKELLGLNYAGGGFAPSIIGGFYLDFGDVGVLVCMLLLGFFLQKTYIWMLRSLSPHRILVYAFVLANCLFFIRGGFLPEIFPLWGLIVIVLSAKGLWKRRVL